MSDWIEQFVSSGGFGEPWSSYIANIIILIAIVIISFAIYRLAKDLVLRLLKKTIEKSRSKVNSVFMEHKVFDRLIIIIPALIVYSLAPMLIYGQVIIGRIALCLVVLGVIRTIDKGLGATEYLYKKTEAAKAKPIKGFLQVIKIVVYLVGLIVAISILMDQSPVLLLGGLGAASAVLLLVFQNTILGFVASIQLTENDMVRIGDWIETRDHHADGEVKEITLYTVKVENWDKTVTMVPTYSMVTESFKNWRSMQEAGARRIMRSVLIDVTSVKFCTEELLERYKKIQYIEQYLMSKEAEIETYNQQHHIDVSSPVNGRRMTNLGVFRAYLESYLKNHPHIHKKAMIMVRQLDLQESGLSIEIYAFADTTDWAEYECIQADIFDHIFAVIPEFDLRIYQQPSGYDLRSIGSSN
ncbi:MAG: mechanosensitive ion channel [Coriobacteriaceae bacterium]|nr:mechanosensitive ion channel [Coriobacteriaceae bacterium]